MKTIGKNIADFRKAKGITQEKLAEICGVTPQAVSKWENDLSCPDIAILRLLARTLGVTVDELLNEEDSPLVQLAPTEDKKGKILRIRVLDGEDKVNVNIPITLIELLLKNGLVENMFGKKKKGIELIDFEQVMQLVYSGAIGKIVEVDSEDGTHVEVWVE